MKKKTFHIGEYCLHGTVQVILKGVELTVKFFNYKTRDLQEEKTFHFVDKFKMRMYLEDRMSSYYADKVMDEFYA